MKFAYIVCWYREREPRTIRVWRTVDDYETAVKLVEGIKEFEDPYHDVLMPNHWTYWSNLSNTRLHIYILKIGEVELRRRIRGGSISYEMFLEWRDR